MKVKPMSKLSEALKKKFRTPQEVIRALGLDENLVVGDAALGGNEENDMVMQLTPKAAMAAGMFLGRYGAKLQSAGMAMDTASTLFNPIFAGITSKNFGAQRPALDAALRAALKGKLANDADISDVTELLQAIEGVEAGADTVTEANSGLPSYMHEEPEDADDETLEEREEDEGCDRRADDARRRLGRDETEEEKEEREEAEDGENLSAPGAQEDPPQGREPNLLWDRRRADDWRHADDRRRADAADRRARDARYRADDMRNRAEDARKRLGRDESEEEREKRESEIEAKDARQVRDRARDRRRLGRDYRRARDAHRPARDAHRKAVADWRRASDGHKSAMDGKRADDAARHARDMRDADDAARKAHDAMVRARDARHRARDARRAHDKRFGRDEPPPFPGRPNTGGTMEPMTKAAIDEAIERRVADAVRANDQRHTKITEAFRVVRSKVGELAMDSSIRNASDVYDRALTVLGVEHAGIRDEIALKRLFEIAPRPGGDPRRNGNGFAQDAAPASAFNSFAKRFPGAASIEQI